MSDTIAFLKNEYGIQILLCCALLLMIAVLSVASPFFWQWENLRNILDQSAVLIIISIGMTIVIASGGIDLSVGAVAALSGVVAAICLKLGVPVVVAVLAAMGVGALTGMANGGLISCLNLNPFIVTLGTSSIARGVALILTQGIPIYGFASSFTWLGKGFIMGLPVPVWLATITAALGAVTVNCTKLGYYALAMGGNEEALRRTGVSVSRYKTAVYAICGLTASLAGIIVTTRLNTAEPTAGWMFELEAIAATVLGGTSMKGGVSSTTGTVIACLLLGVLHNGLTILSIHSYYQQLLIGVIILVSVVLSELRAKNIMSWTD